MISAERLQQILGQFSKLSVIVVGDYFLDKYLVIDPSLSETSLETGKETLQVVEVRHSPGAAGNVCTNLAALGPDRIWAVGLIGDDGPGYELKCDLTEHEVTGSHLIQSRAVFTPTYIKPMEQKPDGTEAELNRLDINNRQPLAEAIESQLIESLRSLVPRADAVVIVDQVPDRNRGVITDRVRGSLADLAATHSEVVFLADSRTRIGQFQNIALKPNRYEAAIAVQGETPPAVPQAVAESCGRELAARTGRPVFVTLDAEGISVCTAASSTHVPTVPPGEPIDIAGAGDSTAAGIVCSLCCGASLAEAALIGNIAASVTIQQIGTTGTATHGQILAQFERGGWNRL